MTVKEVENKLIGEKIVSRPRSLKRSFKKLKVGIYIKPGRYEIRSRYSSVYLARMLNNGWQSPGILTISGTVRSKGVLARKIALQMMVDSSDIIKALNDSSLLAGFGFDTTNVFSLVIPDSYRIYWTASPGDILRTFFKGYESFWNGDRKKSAETLGLTPLKVSILASIVSGETHYEPEMSSIAGVYLNRLHHGMKLQADPTVAYCFGYKLNRIYGKHTKFDSPYNTYKYYGLPPGPICVPSKASLDAVLHPAKESYLYFCASPEFNGTHIFAKSYFEHRRNARAFQRALNVRQSSK
jgi:UPF0755 protein